jgi:hypothetical protein
MQGGTMTSGRACTVDVDGAYWISSISSLRNTTWPGVVARFLPTSYALSSLIVMRPRAMSAARLAAPRARLAPSVRSASATTSGFVAAKFDGASASTNWRVANSSRRLSSAGSDGSAAIARR